MEQSGEGEEERALTVLSFFGILEAAEPPGSAGRLQDINPEGYFRVKLCFIFST